MVFIQLVLQESAHLSEFLIALRLYALDKVHEFPVVLICHPQAVPHLDFGLLFALHLLFQEAYLLHDLVQVVVLLVVGVLEVGFQLGTSVTLLVCDGLGFPIQTLHCRLHALYLGHQVVDHAFLRVEFHV